ECLGGGGADGEGADEPGPGGDGDGVHLAEGEARLGKTLAQRRAERLQVRSGGDLRHDPAEPGVGIHGGGGDVGEEVEAANNRDPGLVAGGFDTQHYGLALHASQLTPTARGLLAPAVTSLRGSRRRDRSRRRSP